MADEAEKKPDMRDEIDANLKRVYQKLAEEEVPDRFRALLEELRRKGPQR